MSKMDKNVNKQRRVAFGMAVLSVFLIGTAYAEGNTIGTMASNITATLGSVGKLITGVSYVSGLGFAIGAILKFKQHKDNPTQVQIGHPIGLLFIAIALLFLPSLLKVAGSTAFGTATTSGPGGTTITGS